jgi:hypothetical protein
VIKIRYSAELQPGLHGQTERCGRTTVVKLLAGLTPAQRAATLRRLTQQGRMGIGPRLPVVQLMIALSADRMRTAFGQVGAVVRIHPAGSTVPVMVLFAAAFAFLALSSVSIHIIHQPQTVAGSAFGTAPTGAGEPSGTAPSPGAGPATPGQQGAQQGVAQGASPGQQPADAAGSSAPGTGGAPSSGTNPSSGGGPVPGVSPTPVTGSGTSSPPGGTTLTSTAATTPPTAVPTTGPIPGPPTTEPSPAPVTSPTYTSPSPAPSPTQATSAGGSGGSGSPVCLDIGPLGICLSL